MSLSLWFLFDWYDETLGLNRLDFVSYCLPSQWVRVALLLCALMVTLRLFPVLGGLEVPPTVRLRLNSEKLLGRFPLPLDKGKGRVSLIEYPGGSDYLKFAVQHAITVGPSKVDPSYGATFSKRYRPPTGVRVRSPGVLTFM